MPIARSVSVPVSISAAVAISSRRFTVVLGVPNSSARAASTVAAAKFVEEGFETVTSCCPVPIVIAGGKKMPELEALKMAGNAIAQGANGVDMGRNIFQSESPTAMIQAVRAVVHQGETPDRAFELYNTLKSGQ